MANLTFSVNSGRHAVCGALVRHNTQLTRHVLSHARWGRVGVMHLGSHIQWAVVV